MHTARSFHFLFFLLLVSAAQIYAQRIALISPVETSQSALIQNKLIGSLSKNHKIINNDLANSVFQSANFENSYNLSTEDAQNLGNAVGCDYFLLLKAENLRRTSLAKPEYYESYLAIYVVSSRTGRLIFWKLKNVEAENTGDADQKLFALVDEKLTSEISASISAANKNEFVETLPDIAELPDENSPEAKDFRSPLPYRRIRPTYTSIAGSYNITATVDALVDLDEKGQITRIEITRWAGYELDESVIKTIREMQWRAASREGKPLPIRVLLRYNFKKIEKDN